MKWPNGHLPFINSRKINNCEGIMVISHQGLCPKWSRKFGDLGLKGGVDMILAWEILEVERSLVIVIMGLVSGGEVHACFLFIIFFAWVHGILKITNKLVLDKHFPFFSFLFFSFLFFLLQPSKLARFPKVKDSYFNGDYFSNTFSLIRFSKHPPPRIILNLEKFKK